MKTVRVRPAGDWWMVEADGLSAPLMFARGSDAERAGRQLAIALTETSGSTFHVELRDGGGYRFLCRRGESPGTARFEHLPAGALH